MAMICIWTHFYLRASNVDANKSKQKSTSQHVRLIFHQNGHIPTTLNTFNTHNVLGNVGVIVTVAAGVDVIVVFECLAHVVGRRRDDSRRYTETKRDHCRSDHLCDNDNLSSFDGRFYLVVWVRDKRVNCNLH